MINTPSIYIIKSEKKKVLGKKLDELNKNNVFIFKLNFVQKFVKYFSKNWIKRQKISRSANACNRSKKNNNSTVPPERSSGKS